MRTLGAVVEEGVDQQLNGFVGAVGERELIFLDAEECGEVVQRGGVFGIDGEVIGSEILRRALDDASGAADGVFIEVETQLAFASAAGRRIGGHAAHGFTRVKSAARS